MKNLSNEELMNISGGGVNVALVAAVSAGIAFIIGIFDGIVRPLKCR